MKLYHGSNYDFEWPRYDSIVKNRENHANGDLGLWCSTNPEHARRFGKYIYEIELNVVHKVHLDVGLLFQMKDSLYRYIREDHLQQGVTLLRIEEHAPRPSELHVILDLSPRSIKSFKKVSL